MRWNRISSFRFLLPPAPPLLLHCFLYVRTKSTTVSGTLAFMIWMLFFVAQLYHLTNTWCLTELSNYVFRHQLLCKYIFYILICLFRENQQSAFFLETKLVAMVSCSACWFHQNFNSHSTSTTARKTYVRASVQHGNNPRASLNFPPLILSFIILINMAILFEYDFN